MSFKDAGRVKALEAAVRDLQVRVAVLEADDEVIPPEAVAEMYPEPIAETQVEADAKRKTKWT